MMRAMFLKIVNMGHLEVRYTFLKALKKKKCYTIEITCGSESVLLSEVADSYPEAKDFFDMLVRGTVTPITAEDVFVDWKYLQR